MGVPRHPAASGSPADATRRWRPSSPGQVIVMTWLMLVFLVALALGCWRYRTDSRDGRDWTSVPPDTRTTRHCC